MSALVYNDRIIRGPAWCGDCDRPRDECRCAAWAEEARLELRCEECGEITLGLGDEGGCEYCSLMSIAAESIKNMRLGIIARGRAHPLRRHNVKFVKILEA